MIVLLFPFSLLKVDGEPKKADLKSFESLPILPTLRMGAVNQT
jgi:hypothetical protein